MRTTIYSLMRALGRAAAVPEPIYEFGAYRIPGQESRGDVRACFPGRTFVGCDLSPGRGVDEIQDLHRLTLADGAIGTALLLDTIEHVREPFRAMAEVARCLRPGGLLVMTSVMYFPIHLHPDDYWRFTASGFASLVHPFDRAQVEMIGLRTLPHTVLAVAYKAPVEPALADAVAATVATWKRRGATSWKEIVLALAPPCLLVPAYDLYVAYLGRAQGRRV
jgi:SAM-dependent methyltransferase